MFFDNFGSSRGLIISIWEIISLYYSFAVSSGLVIIVDNWEIDSNFHILNLCETYNDKEQFWDRIFSLGYPQVDYLIIGRDLNSIVGRNEVRGLHAREDILENYFIDHLESVGWVDLDLVEVVPT